MAICTTGLTLNFKKFDIGAKTEEFRLYKSGISKLTKCIVVPHHPLKSNTFPPFKYMGGSKYKTENKKH